MDQDSESESQVSRRGAVALFATLGIGTLGGGCAGGNASEAASAQALSGAAIRWVDTVLGASPPNARTGDLTQNNSAALGNAILILAKGCLTPGDGGGGLYFWDTNPGTDNGGTVIVPNGNRGSSGACWRKIR